MRSVNQWLDRISSEGGIGLAFPYSQDSSGIAYELKNLFGNPFRITVMRTDNFVLTHQQHEHLWVDTYYTNHLAASDLGGKKLWRTRLPRIVAPVVPIEENGHLIFVAGGIGQYYLLFLDSRSGRIDEQYPLASSLNGCIMDDVPFVIDSWVRLQFYCDEDTQVKALVHLKGPF